MAKQISGYFSDYIDFDLETTGLYPDKDSIVGHNIHRFDIPFVKNAAEKCGKTLFMNQYMDTLPLSQALYPEMKSHSEEVLCERFGVINQGAHRSVNDCMANQQLYEIMGKEFEVRKQ